MPLTIEDFEVPVKHPFGMLRGHERAYEKEKFLAWMLKQSIKRGGFLPIKTVGNEDHLVPELLLKVGEQEYRLSEKSIRLLYVHYGKG